MALNTYSSITSRSTLYPQVKLLENAKINNILDQFGQRAPIPKNNTKTTEFRRYTKFSSTPIALQEGVTPSGKAMSVTDISASLTQYGDFTKITDQIRDFHEDPVMNAATDLFGIQAPELYDKVYAGVLKAGTTVQYTNGTARTDVNTWVDRADFRTAIRTLKAQETMKLRSFMEAGAKISTTGIQSCYIAVCHSDLQPDLEQVDGWVPLNEYPTQRPIFNGEIGAVGEIRFAFDNNLTPWADGGGTYNGSGTATISTTGSASDVYPILIFGKDSYGIVPLGGKGSVEILVNQPKPSDSDPLAQRGSIGWKGYTTAVILNDSWMLRLETAARG